LVKYETKEGFLDLHATRHTAITRGSRVMPVFDLKTFARHAKIETTMRYVHTDEEQLREQVELLPPVGKAAPLTAGPRCEKSDHGSGSTRQRASSSRINRLLPENETTELPESLIWPWLRNLLVTQPAYVARKVGIPAIASLSSLPLPRPPLSITKIIGTYKAKGKASDKAKNEALRVFERLRDFCGAKKLDDFTTERLSECKTSIEENSSLKSAGTRAAYYGRCRSVVSFGKKAGLDSQQISACLDRMAVLWESEPLDMANGPQQIVNRAWNCAHVQPRWKHDS
jgi:hypothetical protein